MQQKTYRKNKMNNQVSAFLSAHNFVNHVDVLTVAQAILDDMKKGLRKEGSDQDMIRTFCRQFYFYNVPIRFVFSSIKTMTTCITDNVVKYNG